MRHIFLSSIFRSGLHTSSSCFLSIRNKNQHREKITAPRVYVILYNLTYASKRNFPSLLLPDILLFRYRFPSVCLSPLFLLYVTFSSLFVYLSDVTAMPETVHQVFMQRASQFFSLGASFSRPLCVYGKRRKKGEYERCC